MMSKMFLVKFLTQLIYPLNLSLTVGCLAVLFIFLKRKKTGLVLVVLSLSWLFFWSTPMFSDRIRSNLERTYLPRRVEDMETADAIVVLGGGVASAEYPRIYPDLNSAADRVWHAARLYKAGKAKWVILSGGIGLRPTGETDPEANAMAVFLGDLGVPDSAVLLESESLNTLGNAKLTKRLLDEHGLKKILLVTSALHMRRAQAIFLSLKIDSIPAPTDYELPRALVSSWLPDAVALEGSALTLKEYLGLFVFEFFGI
jgi:uncharacterized SAM-binding protein YcdF (DUF218 family)